LPKHPHILNAASNLLGIALLVITGLHVSNVAGHSTSDEVAWAAAFLLSFSCLTSYLAIRAEPRSSRFEAVADVTFLAGLLALVMSVLVLAIQSA
jgi:hypothetical protein